MRGPVFGLSFGLLASALLAGCGRISFDPGDGTGGGDGGARGRQGRQWLDGPGNFMGSTVVRLSPHDPPPASLSFVAALAVYAAAAGRIPPA